MKPVTKKHEKFKLSRMTKNIFKKRQKIHQKNKNSKSETDKNR